ncbi:hypothetical protein ABZP36_032477 [Zizania latifolia]
MLNSSITPPRKHQHHIAVAVADRRAGASQLEPSRPASSSTHAGARVDRLHLSAPTDARAQSAYVVTGSLHAAREATARTDDHKVYVLTRSASKATSVFPGKKLPPARESHLPNRGTGKNASGWWPPLGIRS